MKKILVILLGFGLSFVFYVHLASAAALTAAQKLELTNKLQTDCYDQYKDDAYNTRGIEIGDMSEASQVTPDEVQAAKEKYQNWAQMNVDLLACYKKDLAGYPDLAAQVDTQAKTADGQLATVNSFDFAKLLTPKDTVSAVVSVPANSTKIFRLRTLCLDSGRGTPSAGQEYYLSGSVDELNRQGVCALLAKAQASGADLGQIQGSVWDSQKLPETKTKAHTWAAKIKAFAMAGGGLILFIVLLILGRFIGSNRRALRILWLIGLIGLLAVSGYGAWKLYDLGYFSKAIHKTTTHKKVQHAPIQTASGKTSLVDASRNNDVIVQAYSTGDLRETDVKITNHTNKELQLDTSCIYFIPKQTASSMTTSMLKWFKSIVAFATSDSNMDNNSDMGAQKLGSAGDEGDGPPQPDSPPTPEDMLKNLTDRANADLAGAMSDFNGNPSEANLKGAMKGMQECQAVGCGGDQAAFDQLGNGWQNKVDNETTDYTNNPTDSGRDNLQRDSELCQILNCDPSGALGTLGLQ